MLAPECVKPKEYTWKPAAFRLIDCWARGCRGRPICQRPRLKAGRRPLQLGEIDGLPRHVQPQLQHAARQWMRLRRLLFCRSPVLRCGDVKRFKVSAAKASHGRVSHWQWQFGQLAVVETLARRVIERCGHQAALAAVGIKTPDAIAHGQQQAAASVQWRTAAGLAVQWPLLVLAVCRPETVQRMARDVQPVQPLLGRMPERRLAQ